jgi:glycosyltransferase involved in cell wall biosynthesis
VAAPDRSKFVVAFVGRLVRCKRVDRLLEAVARVSEHTEIEVLIVGSGPLKTELRDLSRRLSLEESVRFLGFRSDVADLLRDADVLVQPSTGEGFGLAIIEACMSGLVPIVFADGGGALEVLPPDGRVVSDVEGLAVALLELKSSASLSPQARQARSTWAIERFPITKTASEYAELYRAVATQ